MKTSEIFDLLLEAVDDVGRVFDFAEIARWPTGQLQSLQELGLLRQAAGGLHAPCPNCDDGHVEQVIIRPNPGGPMRYFIQCPESMRVEVTAEMCIGWQVDGDGVAKAISAAMDLKSVPKTMVPGRLWKLGRTPWKQSSREVVWATRLHDADAATVVAHLGPGGRAIVFVPMHAPDERVWPGHRPAVVALSRVATLTPQGIQLDVAAITEIVSDADAQAEARSILPVDPQVKKRVIRQQLKAEAKSQLEDDVLVAAYKMYGSVRKAAEALTKQLKTPITKDKVQGAITRAGGAKALREEMDSPSVARTVASQSRDRAKKVLERR